MTKVYFFLLAALCLMSGTASAGLFSDTEARQQISQLNTRLAASDAAIARLETALNQLETSFKQQLQAASDKHVSALLDLQASIDTLNTELRRLRGQNEELAHSLQAAEKRQQDFYVDLDARIRRLESAETSTTRPAANKTHPDETLSESATLDEGLALYKAERYENAVAVFQLFLKAFPKSERIPDVRAWMGNAFFVLKDYTHSLENYQALVDQFGNTYPHLSEVMFNIADCQDMLDNTAAAKATLQSIIRRFPNTEVANKARKQLSTLH